MSQRGVSKTERGQTYFGAYALHFQDTPLFFATMREQPHVMRGRFTLYEDMSSFSHYVLDNTTGRMVGP